MKICIRKSDGAMFLPSCPDEYRATSVALTIRLATQLAAGELEFYFKKLEPICKRWWHTKQLYLVTNEVWQPPPKDKLFEVKELTSIKLVYRGKD